MIINIDRYLIMECEWKPLINPQDSEYGIETEAEPVILKCFKYSHSGGRNSFVVMPDDITLRQTTAYIVKEPAIKEGDLIDGMVVNTVDLYTDIDGKYMYSWCQVI